MNDSFSPNTKNPERRSLKDFAATKWLGFKTLFSFDNWPQLLLDRTLFTKTASVIHRLGPMEILIDYHAGEQNGTRACVGSRSYECFLQDPVLRKRPLNVMDLGANGGGFPLLLRLLGCQIERLLAVELNPKTFARLSFNIGRNIDAPSRLVQGAAAARDGMLEVVLGGGSISDTIRPEGLVQGGALQRVPSYSFDTLFQMCWTETEVIDLCKIDIEGAEHEIFDAGAARFFDRCDRVIMEVHGGEAAENRFHTIMAGKGFLLSPLRSPFEPNVFLYLHKRIS